MCCSCNETHAVFTLEFVTAEPVQTNMEMYHAIAHSLFQGKVISNINVANNRCYKDGAMNKFSFELHLSNTHNAAAVNLEAVSQALAGLTDQFTGYSQLQITQHEHVHTHAHAHD